MKPQPILRDISGYGVLYRIEMKKSHKTYHRQMASKVVQREFRFEIKENELVITEKNILTMIAYYETLSLT